jgi:hypothetical protein
VTDCAPSAFEVMGAPLPIGDCRSVDRRPRGDRDRQAGDATPLASCSLALVVASEVEATARSPVDLGEPSRTHPPAMA